MKGFFSDAEIVCAAPAGRLDTDIRIFEYQRLGWRAAFAPHRFQKTVRCRFAANDVGARQDAVDLAVRGIFVRSSDAKMAHRIVDIGPTARRDDPYPSALSLELPTEIPQRFVQAHRVEKGRVKGDFAQA